MRNRSASFALVLRNYTYTSQKTRIKAERGPGEPSALRCQWTEAGRHRLERVGADFPVTHPSTLLSCSVTITTITLFYNSLKNWDN